MDLSVQPPYDPDEFGVDQQTRRITAELKLELCRDVRRSLDYNMLRAFNGLERAVKTGRLHTPGHQYLKSLSGYEYTQLLCTMASQRMSEDDVSRYINMLGVQHDSIA